MELKDYKIAWFTEGNWTGEVPRDHPNRRNDVSWMHALNATHYPVTNIPDDEFDLGIITVPKNTPVFDFEKIKRVCKKVAMMQEGPHWYFQDYTMEQQIWFYNTIADVDFIFCHNEIDKKYYEGVTNKRCYIMPALMITDDIVPRNEWSDAVIIGGNMVRWYGGFDSYLVAQQFDMPICAPSMGRKIEREDELDITHLPYMTWVEWLHALSQFHVGVHLMPTWAAGTFTLNCAFHGIPCIGYIGLDTQTICHPMLSVESGDVKSAMRLATQLKDDSSFYEECSTTARDNYESSLFVEENFMPYITEIIEKEIKWTNHLT
ncbi:MAG TPA: hypothetical protein QGH56_09560 [Candidatus Marinimicrobia bacterium]|nr:hypothetical protein [Candidatus Neomarinimicrobiota bacterium]